MSEYTDFTDLQVGADIVYKQMSMNYWYLLIVVPLLIVLIAIKLVVISVLRKIREAL